MTSIKTTACLITPATLAARLARNLSHGCAPAQTEFDSVADLLTAMRKKSEDFNEKVIMDYEKVEPWSGDSRGLTHTTGSGRMEISVTDEKFFVGLFSPSYEEAQVPFFTCRVEGGNVTCNIPQEAFPLLEASPRRLAHVGGYLHPLLGDAIFQNVSPKEGELMTQLALMPDWADEYSQRFKRWATIYKEVARAPARHLALEAGWDQKLYGASY